MRNLDDFVGEKLSAWKDQYIQSRVAWLSINNIQASSNLINSFSGEVAKGEGEVSVNISFPDYGRIIDMRKKSINYQGGLDDEGIMLLKDWIKRKGIEKFKPGYLKRKKSIPEQEETLLNNIAWGISRNRSKNKFRRRAWYAKPTAASVNELYNQVAAGMLDVAADNISEQLKQ